VLEKIAHELLRDVKQGRVDERDITEEMKSRVAKANLIYDSTLIGRALDSARHQQQKKALR